MPDVIFNGPEGRLEGRYQHSKALEQRVEKYRRELVDLEESQEQKELDERNARRNDGSAVG